MAADLTLLPRVSYRGAEITAPRLRGLLALLASDLRTGASTARLVEGLWPGGLPENPTKAVQVVVSRARTQLGPHVIASTPNGYRLTLAEEQVDASAVVVRAFASAQRARAGDHAAALDQAEAGLALWEGTPATEGVPDDPVAALRLERLSTYRALVRSRALALSRLDRFAEAVDALVELAGQWPRDEEVLLELLRCVAASAGAAAALARYETYRRGLRTELGTDPGPALQALQRDLLRGTAPAVRTGVHHEPNELLGRDADIAAVTDLLRTSRVASIVGPGGLGKTRLAHAVSRTAQQRVVHVVPLAGVADDADVAGEVAAALGVGEARRTTTGHALTPADVVSGIAAALGPGPALLVLDNCEHIVKGAAELVESLVCATRDVRVLTTSRAPLDLSSESVYPLPELDLTTAVELFRQRARAARPGVGLPDDAVTEVVRHLDGLPLAIELAAARVRAMSVAEISTRLTDRFALLRGGPRTAPERHRTLQSVVDWSWNLLGPRAQAAMRALSVFPGGFTVDAARSLVGDDAIGVLEHLIDQSLLKAAETATGTRFQMLETVREFSAGRREEAGEAEATTAAYLAWAREFGVRHHDRVFGPDPYQTVDAIRAEQDNLLYAMRLALARADGGTVAATAAVLLCQWTVESTNYGRMRQVAEETGWLLSHYRPAPGLLDATRAALTLSAGYAFLIEGARTSRAVVALRRLPPAPATTLIRAAAQVVVETATDPTVLLALAESGEPLVRGVAGALASYVWENAGQLDRAADAVRRVLDALDPRRTWLANAVRTRLAELCLQLERGEEAARNLSVALPVCDRLGAHTDVMGLKWWLVLCNLQMGALDEAERWLAQTDADQVEDLGAYTYGQGVRAEILLVRGHVDAGLALWRRIVDSLRTVPDPNVRRFADDLDPWMLEARSVAIVAHARHDHTGQVADIVAELPGQLTAILTRPVPNPPPYLMEFPVCGAMLLALAAVRLAEGGHAGTAARMTALAERLRYLRAFQPTMSSARARQAAEQADRAAYEAAVSAYATLDRDGLRDAALELLRD